ncbi:MAG: transporter substrate-binding and LysM peptidoglycan-binding domain-containing protein [Myxococcota bacterium]
MKRLLVVMGLFALACARTETPAPPPPPPAPKAVGFAAVREAGKLRVAADPDAAPFLVASPEGGWEGFEWAIIQAIAGAIGVPAQIVPTQFDDLATRLKEGGADLAIGQVSPSAAYEGLAFSVSYLQYSFCLVVPAKSKVKSVADLRGKRVAMYDDPVAKQLADVLVGASYDRRLFSDYGYFEQMAKGELDAVIYDCPLARHELARFGEQLRVADDALNVATYNVAARAEDTKLVEEVNGVLRELGDKGLLASLEQRWLAAAGPAEDYESDTGRVVVVKRGDTLSLVAARVLGDSDRWKDLYAANRDVVGPDPNVIYTGMRLRVPAK